MDELNPRVALVKVPVADFAAATAFYRETLGLAEDFAVEEYGWAQYRLGDVPLCLYRPGMGGGNGVPGGDTGIHLAVDDAAVAFERLRERGAEFACELTVSDEGASMFEVKDPDGNTIKIVGG